MVPAGRSDPRNSNETREIDARVVRPIWFLDKDRAVDAEQQGQIVQTIADAYRFKVFQQAVHPPLALVTTKQDVGCASLVRDAEDLR